jgi:hypothetical protein
VSQREQVLDRTPGTGHVVDVDARHVEAGQRPLQDDREAFRGELGQRRIVQPGSGDDQPIGVLRTEQPVVGSFGRERLDHDPGTCRPCRRRQPAQGLGEGCIARDLLRRLAQHQAEDMASAAGQLPRGSMRVVAELGRRAEDALASDVTDLDIGSVIQHEGDRRARHPGTSRDVRAGRSRSSHRTTRLHPPRRRSRLPRSPRACRLTRVSNAH